MKDLVDNNEHIDKPIDIIDDPYFGVQTCTKRIKHPSNDKLEKIMNG